MIVAEEAFEELLDRVERLELAAARLGEPDDGEDDEVAAFVRQQFAASVDRAVNKVLAKRGKRGRYALTLRRHGCRLHFVRDAGRVVMIACLPLDDGDAEEGLPRAGYST